MVIKSFFADSVAQAIQEAREQFGEEALLLKTRKTPEEWRSQGAYEVVFGLAGDAPEERDVRAGVAVPAPPGFSAFRPGETRLGLLAAGFSASVVHRLLAATQVSARETASQQPEDLLAEEGARIFRADSSLGSSRDPWRIALIGPGGSGKTLTAVRLAVMRGIACNRKVRILSACDGRIGGAERTRCYAALLEVRHEVVGDANALRERLSEETDASTLTIVDTPGVSAGEVGRYEAMARVLAEASSVQKHLTLPATMNAEDLRKVTETFGRFAFDRLIFSRLDETRSLGAMLSLIAATGKPASFFTTGQDVPGDISPAESLNVRKALKSCLQTAHELAA